MIQIEVPDWVAADVLSRYSALCVERGGSEPWPPELARKQRQEDMHAALTAALGAWVVPEQFQVRDKFMELEWGDWRTLHYEKDRDREFDRFHQADGWQAEKRDLYTLRQEKPE